MGLEMRYRLVPMRLRALSFLLVTLVSSSAFADPPSIDRVRTLLSSFEAVAPEAAWRALGPETVQVLRALYEDRDELPFVRMRAVEVAGYYPTEASHTFLREVVRTPDQNDLILRRALRSLTRAFGEQAIDDVRPFLTHRVVIVREAAVRALATVEVPRVRTLLQARLERERDPEVRRRLEVALGR